jgi:plasmid segregation protein ParM
MRLQPLNRFGRWGVFQQPAKRSVNVKRVKVLAQPVGGLLDYIDQQDESETGFLVDDDARVLVVDPGFFSLDCVLVSNGQLQRQSSGTSLKASSVLLEQAARLIAEDFGGTPTIEILENAVRNKKASILIMGQRVNVTQL